jgi:hypothetical protein
LRRRPAWRNPNAGLKAAQELTHNRQWAAHQLFPGKDGFSQYQQPARLKLADRVAALAALKLGQVDAGLGMTPAHILWRSVIWRRHMRRHCPNGCFRREDEPNGGKSQQIGREKQARPGGPAA